MDDQANAAERESNSEQGPKLCPQCIEANSRACPHLSGAFDNVIKDPLIGKLLGGRYQVEDLIGSGGFGRVYRVFHTGLKSHMALKLLHSFLVLQTDKLERFKQEAEAISKLDHPNICRITDFAEGPEKQPCMIMELLQGQRLDELLKEKGHLSRAETIEIGLQVCSALSSAHKRNIIHRDLKPANIMLVPDEDGGENHRVKVLDFGLAKIMEEESESGKSLTQTGGIIGTPQYMSPEQCLGRNVDGRTDVYSIGCIFYEMVAGKKAFDGNSHLEIMNAHLQKTPAPFTNASSEEMDKQLEAAVFKAMDADIDQRYQNVDELYSDLQKLQQNQSIDIKKKPAAQEAKKPSKLLIALCATAAVLAAYYAGSSLNPESENTIIRGGQDGIQYKAHREDVVNGKTIADYNLAIEEKPKDPEVYYDRGWYHQVRDERDSAIEDYSTAIKLDPGFARAYPNRSEMYLMVTKYDKAMADVDKAIKLMPRWYNAYSQRARLEMLMQNYDKAIADANRALELNVICEQALAVLSLVYGELGDHQKALSYITYEGRWQDPNNADDMYWWHFERGMVYLHANDFDHAIEDFKAALAKHHLMSQSWGEMARAYAAKNNMPEALSCIEKAVSLDLFPARALRLKGEMYRAGGKWVEAVQEYSSSTSLEPWYGQGFEQRALAEIALGQMHSAELDLQKAVQLEPFAGTSRAWLALAEDQLGNGEEAKKQLDKGFALLPKKPIMFAIRACISMHTGDFARAIEDCNQAISMDNRLAEGYAYRAIALEAIGKKDEAEKDHATAVKLGWHDYASPLKIGKAQSNEVPKLVQRPLQELDARTEAKVEQQQLTDAQKWAISCGRIWTDRLISNKIRNDDVEALEIMNVAPNNTKWAKQFLERTFNISNRESVLQFISNEGHYGDKYKEIAKKLAGMNEAEVGEFAKQADSYEQGQVGIVLKYKNQPNVDASAFDSVRVITVVRCAFLAGYLNEEESWDYIMQFAKKVQAGNSSWDQFISNYLIGREFFYGGEVPESREVNETIANWRKEPGLGPKRWPFKLDLNKAVKRAPQHT